MLPGPPVYIACTHCAAPAHYRLFLSWNTFGVTVWTDGVNLAPMTPIFTWVTRCSTCGGYYWLEDADELPFDPDRPFPPEVHRLNADDYLGAIDAGLADDARGFDLKVWAWQRYNDAFRDRPPGSCAPPVTGRYRALIEELSDFTPVTVNDQLFRAELTRSLGRFSEASTMLMSITGERSVPYVAVMRARCAAQDPGVARVPGGRHPVWQDHDDR
ncbi:hypothetical protein [Deinococcus sp. JMULE3]|uniref:hypothetical protein n=1 Tax=Deinococcus sp. JMULE3 TaxID=2518341 RepID=UPI0015762FA7|nr:hypothetical protein [Deinococcus sp. JMULE3]NTY02598.1 hypothetical protein [Deinococcus sp. JMULE3]